VGFIGRIVLWIIMIVAPGGVFLLPFLVGDAVAQRRRRDAAAAKHGGAPAGVAAMSAGTDAHEHAVAAPCSTR
jgi:hypothetical protein